MTNKNLLYKKINKRKKKKEYVKSSQIQTMGEKNAPLENSQKI